MNKMLNTSTSMAYHNRFTNSSPSSSGSSSSSSYRRSLRSNANDDNMMNIYSTADLIGSDYFVSSLDFEYDLFLNGLVNCDNSGYRNRIRNCHNQQQQKQDGYDYSMITKKTTTNYYNYNHNDNVHQSYRDDMTASYPGGLTRNNTRDTCLMKTTSPHQHHNGNHHHHLHHHNHYLNQPVPIIDSSSPSSTHSLLTTESLFAVLNSPLSRAASAYRQLQQQHHQMQKPPQRQTAVNNDYITLSFKSNNNTANNSNSSQQNSTTTTTTTTSITNSSNCLKSAKPTTQTSTSISNGNYGNNSLKCNTNAANQIINGATGSNTVGNNCTSAIDNLQQSGKLSNEPFQQSTQCSSPVSSSAISSDHHSSSSTTTNSQPLTNIINNGTLDENGIDIGQTVDNLSHQHLHALHRFRQQRKKGLISRLRDVVISFTPKARCSVVNCSDIYSRYGKEEKDALAAFNFLDNELDATNESMTLEQHDHGADEQINQQLTSKDESVNEQPTATAKNFDLEIDLEMEEYDLLHPPPINCDSNNVLDQDDNHDQSAMAGCRQDDQSTQDRSKVNSSSSYVKMTTENNDRFHNGAKLRHQSPPEYLSSSSSSSTCETSVSSKTNHHHRHHSIKLQKFRFGFPRKSNSLEFQSTMKRLDEIDNGTTGQRSSTADDEDESISGCHSAQETLTNISTASEPANGKSGSRLFLAKNSNFTSANNNNNNNNKKKNRNKKKSRSSRIISAAAMFSSSNNVSANVLT